LKLDKKIRRKDLKNKVMGFIESANKIIFFIAALVTIIIFAFIVIKDVFDQDDRPSSIQIIENKENEPPEEIAYVKNYKGSIQDVYIFEITSDKILRDSSKIQNFSGQKPMYESYMSDTSVNLLFLEGNNKRLLMKNHGLITDFERALLVKRENSMLLSKNVYLITTEDTNADKMLDRRDAKDLMVSKYNGENLTLVMKDIDYYTHIRDNVLLVCKIEGKNQLFYMYDLETMTLNKLDTNI
jgi:hypothetical protein